MRWASRLAPFGAPTLMTRSTSCGDNLGKPHCGLAFVRHEERGKLVRPRHRRRQPDCCELWRMGTQPREVEREEIATLARRQSMQFVEDHDLERAEQPPAPLCDNMSAIC